jgi:hypothetical protein
MSIQKKRRAGRMEIKRRSRGLAALLASALLMGGCASSGLTYVNPDVDFSYMQRAAVVPFQNLSPDHLADERLQTIFLMEILKEDVLEIVDSRETVSAMQAAGLRPGSELKPEQVVSLGKRLGVDAIFFGVVEEYGQSRTDRKRGPEITAVFGMWETETGVVVWQSQVHENGASFWGKIFGGGTGDLYEVSRETVRKALGTLL